MPIVELLIYGLVFGSILALLSSGYALVYGVGRVLNLAHGAFYLLSAYIIFWFVDGGILPYPLAIVASLILITIIGAVTYITLIKPTEKHGEIAVMIVTFALAFFIQNAILLYEGSKIGELHLMSLDPYISGGVWFFGVLVSYQKIIILIGTFCMLSFLIIFIKKSKLGKSIRAVSQDKDAAQLMGIDVHRVLMITVAFSAFLAGFAATLYTPETALYPQFGWDFLLLSMSVVILGGMGSLTGSVIGAFIISFARNYVLIFIDLPFNTVYSGLIHLAIILLMLIIRPRGILGKKERT